MRFIRGHVSRKGKPPEYLVDQDTGCWIWQRYVDPSTGYGNVKRAGHRSMTAHQYFWEQEHGPIPDGMMIDHACHTRAVLAGECKRGERCLHRLCVNLNHLELVSYQENAQRGLNTPLTPESVREIRALKGIRSGSDVARLYGVTHTTIYSIWNGKSWTNVV